MLAGTIYLFTNMPTGFIPSSDSGFFMAAETRTYVPRVLQLHARLKDEFDKGMQLQLDAMHRDGQREGKTLAGGAPAGQAAARR